MDKRVGVCLLCLCWLLLRFATAQRQPPATRLSSKVELSALYSLRSSLALRSRDWPRKTDPCSRWVGVLCRDGHVVGLNVSGLQRTRKGRSNPRFSVDGLRNLTFLFSFNASGFLLPGTIPDWFGELANLTVLDLRSSSVTGSIPASLGAVSTLAVLDLSGNSLSGSMLASAFSPRLSYVNLSGNALTGGIPPQLGEVSSLVRLDLRFNSLSGRIPVELRGCKNLQELLLSSNSFSGEIPTEIPVLPSIRVVALDGNNVTGSFSSLFSSNKRFFSSTSSLEKVLNVSHNLFYGFLSPQLGRVLQRLDSFDLSYNFFQGRVPEFLLDNAVTNSSFRMNCLVDVPFQRTSEECHAFYQSMGLLFVGFSPQLSPKPEGSPVPVDFRKRKKHWKAILGGALGAVGFILLLVLVYAVFVRKSGPKNGSGENKQKVGNPPPGVSSPRSPPPTGISLNVSSSGESFSYERLVHATANFGDRNLIKQGHSGDIYRGNLDGRLPIAVKRIELDPERSEACGVELNFFGRASHIRLVPFLGHCLEGESEKFLVYKYMRYEDLSSYLLHRKAQDAGDGIRQPLDWITRLKIATGAAEALSYLHHEFTPPLVHRDVQASSILLDDNFEVRLGSLSKVCHQEVDAHQCIISRLLHFSPNPEQSNSAAASATCAYDIYCFGKVLLELVTGKLGISGSDDKSTRDWLDWVLPHININEKSLVTKIVDPQLIIDDDLLEEVWAVAIVARSCLNPRPSKRPLMRYILKALKNPLKVVREEAADSSASAKSRTTSSRSSWNAAIFGSWRCSSSDIVAVSSGPHREGDASTKQGGMVASRSSDPGAVSSSRRRLPQDIFVEPSSIQVDKLRD